MQSKETKIISFLLLIVLVIIGSCVEPIEFDIPPAELQTVVEGFISDDPGPYTIRVSEGFSLDDISSARRPISDLVITLIDDLGLTEQYTEVSPGVYQTSGAIEGEIGRSYYIRIEAPGGDIFESVPDMIRSTGVIEDIRFEYEARIVETNVTTLAADVFNILIDGNAGTEEESFTRWRFKGTYEVLTYPELHLLRPPTYTPYPDPFPCSGYVVVGCIGATKIKQISPCECCSCWVSQYEDKPQLSDNLLVKNNEFRNIKIAEVPISAATFHNKYKIEVDQMSMTRQAFEFFRLVRSQKEDASNFFQPTFGEIIGNIKAINNEKSIIGYFWGTSIDRSSTFIKRDDIPYPIVPIEVSTNKCDLSYPFSSTVKPDGWD